MKVGYRHLLRRMRGDENYRAIPHRSQAKQREGSALPCHVQPVRERRANVRDVRQPPKQ